MVVGPSQLLARGQAAEFGGQRAEHAVGGFAGEDAVKHAPSQLLAQGVRRALAFNRIGHGFVGRALRFFAQALHLLGNRDFHGADFHACAAHGAGGWQVAGGLQTEQVRRQDFANRAGISGAVGRAADAGVHRAVVHARAAADALQGAAHLFFAVGLAAAVVQQHEVHFLRAVQLVRTARAGNHVEIGGDVLADGAAW